MAKVHGRAVERSDGKVYASIVEAAADAREAPSSMCRLMNREGRYTDGDGLVYATVESRRSRCGRRVVRDDGTVYESSSDAANDAGCSNTRMRNALCGVGFEINGHTYRFLEG